MPRPLSVIAGVLCVLSTLALAGPSMKVTTEHDSTANFAALRTYRWLPTPLYLDQRSPDARDPRLGHEAIDPPIRAAVDRALADLRLKRAGSTDLPDFHVLYYAAFSTGIDANVLGAHYGYRAGWGSPVTSALPMTSPQRLDEGTLVIDILRSDRAVAMWRGIATGTVGHARTDEERRRTIDTAVREMFAKFPRSR